MRVFFLKTSKIVLHFGKKIILFSIWKRFLPQWQFSFSFFFLNTFSGFHFRSLTGLRKSGTHPHITGTRQKLDHTHTSSDLRDTEPKIDDGYDTTSDPYCYLLKPSSPRWQSERSRNWKEWKVRGRHYIPNHKNLSQCSLLNFFKIVTIFFENLCALVCCLIREMLWQ